MNGDEGLRSAEYWRSRATEARAKADQMRDHDARNTMLGIAHSYDLMAMRAAARDTPSDRGPSR
jgi:hypothetical protein